MKRALPHIIITLFLVGLFVVPGVGILSTARLQDNTILSNEILNNDMLTSDLPNDPVFRVALYNETNTTVPDYHTTVTLNDNYTAIDTLLNSAGYDVTRITSSDIQDYELTTANYDVLVLADNLPRENITNIVKDFWLAGGGVLSLDSALAYLAYGGILYRENESISDGFSEMWYYNGLVNSSILESHPVTQSYQEGDILEVDLSTNKASLRKEKFNQTTVWSQTTVLAAATDDPDILRAVAVDAYDRGGRVVHIGTAGDGDYWSSDWEDMIVDAIAWLAPRPKARIAYDMSHQPRLSVDDWDVFSTLTDATEKFEDLRNTYVSNRYTFDKFVPLASGNFTQARLDQYDILVLAWPDVNYTAAERTALMAWLDAGGGLIVLGDRNLLAGIGQGYLFLNFLLEDLDMYYGENDTIDYQNAVVTHPTHPTIGSASSLRLSFRNYLYISGPAAQSVWEYDGNIAVAAQEYGSGRVVMLCDMNIFSNPLLAQQHNKGYATNVANWLSADEANILVYSDDPKDGGGYRSSVAQVLNQMEIPFYMTVSEVGFNASVNGTWFAQETWDLVILDHCNYFYTSFYDSLYDYLMNDGRAIVNTWMIQYTNDHPIWNLMGANYTANWPYDEPAHIWDTSHDIFETPIDFSAPTMNVSTFFSDDGDMVEVLDNGIALAGYSATEQAGNASIVLRNDGNTLLNSFLLNNMRGDIDESGYLDTLELWFDQIVFMLSLPEIDHPADFTYESGSTGNTITWTPSDSSPTSYEIFVDGVQDGTSTTWDGSVITYNVDGLDLGTHTVEIFVYGAATQPIGDAVVVTVEDTMDPFLTSPADFTMTANTTGNTLTWAASDPNPSHFVILMNSTAYDAGVWDGSSVVLDLDDLTPGIYFFTIRVNDTLGHMSEDTVLVTVNEPSLLGGLDLTTLILIAAGVLGVLIIGAVVCRKRGASQAKPKPRKKKKK
ncbi:MAG: DUF4350 domain-containing protein [Candidatus Thorarchaeota archaeon]